MKKLISILIIVALIVSLCPTALADDVEALKKRIEELEAEIKTKDTIIAALTKASIAPSGDAATAWQQTREALTEAPPPQSTLAPLYDKGPSPTNNDYISIEEVRLVPVEEGKYRPNIKVRCLYPEGALQVYPQQAWVYCYYLNNEDEVIQQFSAVFNHLGYNQAMWSKAMNYSHMNGNDIFDLKEVSKIKFSYYHMITITGGRTSWQNEWDFLTPITFSVADLEIEQ